MTRPEDFAGRLVDTLSGGERQRVWLARLLAKGSRFLLLDEPFAALDIANQIDVLALIRKLCDELNLVVIVVLHDINMALRYRDEWMALHSGRLLAYGTSDDMMCNHMSGTIHRLPMQAHQAF